MSNRQTPSAATGYEFSFQVFAVTAEEAEALFDATASFVHERADQVFGIGPGPIKDGGGEINTCHCPVHAEPTWVARLVDMLLSPAEATRFESLVLEQHLTPDEALDRLFRDRSLKT